MSNNYKTEYSDDKNVNTLDRGSYNDFGDGTPAKQVLAKQAPGDTYSTDSLKNNKLLEYLIAQLGSLEKSILALNNQMILEDSKGTGVGAKINRFNALKVYDQGIPDQDDPAISIPITGFLTDANGSSDMTVNASLANPIDFFISADEKVDKFLTTLSFLISDQNAILSDFGAINELTNGCQLILSTQEVGEAILADNLTTNYSFIRLCTSTPPVSDNVSAFRADNISGNSEGYNAILDINQVFGTAYGLRLRAGTRDKLILRVRDNVSILDAFDCLTFGTRLVK